MVVVFLLDNGRDFAHAFRIFVRLPMRVAHYIDAAVVALERRVHDEGLTGAFFVLRSQRSRHLEPLQLGHSYFIVLVGSSGLGMGLLHALQGDLG